jgi:serine/threonine protein kinase
MVATKLFEPGAGRMRVDRYELVGEIASGGMATVYLARLGGVGGFQRFVAMKRLHPHLQNEKEFVEMFLDEARLSAGIHHPNVVSILEVGASPVGYYLVMEYVEGDTLARILARAAGKGDRIPTPIALRIVIDSLQGLNAAHELKDDKGVSVELVHRDVSPQNILVGIDGVSPITDFGVARATSRLSSTRVGQLKGKLAYMAPEQAQGEGIIDRRADVFSAGVLLWETLAGKRLFKAETEVATLQRVMNEPIPDLARVAPHLSSELCAVVNQALERDPNLRFATAGQFADALESAAVTRDGIAPPRDVAAFVKQMLGEEIEQQRDAVRAWLAKSEPTHPPPLPLVTPSSVSVGAMSIPDGVQHGTRASGVDRAGRRLAVPLAALGAAIAALAAVVVLWLGHRDHAPAPLPTIVVAARPPEPAPLPAPPPAAVDTEVLPVTTPDALPSATAAESAGPPTRPPPILRQARPQKKKGGGEDLNVRNPYR